MNIITAYFCKYSHYLQVQPLIDLFHIYDNVVVKNIYLPTLIKIV